MKNKITVMIFIFSSSGCVGEPPAFDHIGSVNLSNKGYVCVKSSPGDVLSYYLIGSTGKDYAPPLLVVNNIHKVFPDTCFKANLKENVTYEMDYILSNIKYSVAFQLPHTEEEK